jgi:hypothetical protein
MSSTCEPLTSEDYALEYMYRDAANWKTFGLVILADPIPSAMISSIVQTLDSGMLFVAEQVDIPPLQRRHHAEYGSAEDDLDHAFHELVELRVATADDRKHAIQTLPAARVAKLFAAANGRWNCRLSPYGRW